MTRMASHGPQLNVNERSWKKPRRRATHDRLNDTIAGKKGSMRNGLRYFQIVGGKGLTLVTGRTEKGPA